MDQYLESPTITLRIVDPIPQQRHIQQDKSAGRRQGRVTRKPKFPTLIPAAKADSLSQDQLGRLQHHSNMYSTARPTGKGKTKRQRKTRRQSAAGRAPQSKPSHMANSRSQAPTATAPLTAYADGGMFTPAARVDAHAYASQPLHANQKRLTQLQQGSQYELNVPSVQSMNAFDEYASLEQTSASAQTEQKAPRNPVDAARDFHAERSNKRPGSRSGTPAQRQALMVSGASGGFDGFANGAFNPRTSGRPSTAPLNRRPRSAMRPSSAAAHRPASSGGGAPDTSLGATEPSMMDELQQEMNNSINGGGSVAGRVDEALRGRGEFAGAVHREPSERTAPNANAFELRIRDIQNRIEERLARYADASRRPATVHVESLSSIRSGGGTASKYGRGTSFDGLHLSATGHDSDSDDTAELLEDRPSPIKRPPRKTREGLPPRPATSHAPGSGDTLLPSINTSGRMGTTSLPTTPIVHKGGRSSRHSSPDSSSPLQHDFSLSLGSELRREGDDSVHNGGSEFTVSGVAPRRGNSLPSRPHTSAGSRTPVWSGTLAPPTRPARTPTSATAFPGRVMHQRSLRIMGRSSGAGSPQRRVQRPDPNAFRVAMLTLSADMKSGDMVLSLFDPTTAKIHKQTYGAEQLATILPVPASFHSSSHVLKYKWWEQRLHTMADNVTVDVDDEKETITMHLHAPSSSSAAGTPQSASSAL